MPFWAGCRPPIVLTERSTRSRVSMRAISRSTWSDTSAPVTGPASGSLSALEISRSASGNAMGAVRLLLVDDEPLLADLLKRYLERLGYEVDVSASAEHALPLFNADPSRYTLVLTD